MSGSINFGGGPTYYLSVLTNCDDETRFQQWKDAGGALLGNKNIGCGINSLTYLGVFTRPQGAQLVDILNARGTTFDEMMNYVYSRNQVPQIKIPFDISTLLGVQYFINALTDLLCEGCCTIVKLMRQPETPQTQFPAGHTIVFSKNGGVLYATDPQQGTRRRSDNPNLAFTAWQRGRYWQAHVMFNMNGNQEFLLQNNNVVEEIQLLPDHGPIDDRETVPMDIDYGGKKKRVKTKRVKTKRVKTKRVKTKRVKK
jgi:hypothetical protein